MTSPAELSASPRKRPQPTIEDVAELAGVSTATISRSLNEPHRVSAKTRDRVLQAIDQLGYAPNFSAKALAANRTGTIGAIIPTMENAIFAKGLQAFQEELGDQGYTLLVASCGYDPELEAKQIRNFVARGVEGLMLIGSDHDQASYKFLHSRGVPFVNTWTYNSANSDPSVGFDNKAAMQALTGKVLDFGHRSLGIISAPRGDNDRARERVDGVHAAAQAVGIPADDIPILEVNYSISNGSDAFAELMQRDDRPTAIICGNDVLAVGALLRAEAMGLSVPDQVSVTGFDDIELAQVSSPPLTTVHVPHRKMGRHAANLLVDMIEERADDMQVALETTIVMRDTLGSAPTSI